MDSTADMSYEQKRVIAKSIFVKAINDTLMKETASIKISPSVSGKDTVEIKKMVRDMIAELSRKLLREVL